MPTDSVAEGAYRSALRTYFETANELVQFSERAHEAEEAQVKAFAAIGRERGFIGPDDKVADPRGVVEFQRDVAKDVLAELGYGKDHPIAQTVAEQFAQLLEQVELYEGILTSGGSDGPLL